MSRPGSVAARLGEVRPSPTLKVADRARELRAAGRDLIDFSVGQPDFATPAAACDAAKRAIDAGRTGYTANVGIVELREAIRDKLRQDNGLEYGVDEIVVSPGAKASLMFAMQALVDPGDEVLIPAPYWVSYPEQVRLAGGVPVVVPTEASDGYKLRPEALDRAVTAKTSVLVLNSPSNPTGAVYARDELEALVEAAVARGLWIVSDEIYERLSFDGAAVESAAGVSEAAWNQTVTINGLSKAYAMTGWRIGYAAAPRSVVRAMATLQSHDTSNACSIAQWAGVGALRDAHDDVRTMVSAFERRRTHVVDRLRGMDGVRLAPPAGSFYAFPDVRDVLSSGRVRSDTAESLAVELLETAGVALVPGEAFGAPGHLRLSFAVADDRLEEGLDRLARVLAG